MKKSKPSLKRELQVLRRRLSACADFGALRFGEAARQLRVRPTQIRAWVEDGTLLAIPVRGEKMIPRSELRRLKR